MAMVVAFLVNPFLSLLTLLKFKRIDQYYQTGPCFILNLKLFSF